MRQLKLGGMAKNWREVEFRDREQYVSDLLRLELREANRINRMVKTAGFHVIKTLDEFVWTTQIEPPHGLSREAIESLRFLDAKEDLILMGAVGTGKTHLATALALKACQEGRKVCFFTAVSLANLRALWTVVWASAPHGERGGGMDRLPPTREGRIVPRSPERSGFKYTILPASPRSRSVTDCAGKLVFTTTLCPRYEAGYNI